ncbi:helix-turn-helix domain-containing protein, partial [Aeromonas sanarellii]
MLSAYRCAEAGGPGGAPPRRLGKAQSVVSSAIANLEIDLGLEL